MGHTTNRWRARRVHGCAVMSLGMLLIAPFVSADDPGSQPDDRDRSQPLFQSYTVSIASCAAAACAGALGRASGRRRSAARMPSSSARAKARSRMFSSSRTLPGKV